MKNIILLIILISSIYQLSAQCNDETYHPKGEEYARSLTVYQQFIKAKEYEKAIPQWEELYQYCNASFKGKVLNDGEKIYKNLIKETKDEKIKREYALKLAEIQKARIECFGYKIRKRTGRPYRGYRYYYLGKTYILYLKDYENAVKAFDKAIEYDSIYVEPNLLSLYAYALIKLYKEEKISIYDYEVKRDELIEIVMSDSVRFANAYEKMLIEFGRFEASRSPYYDCEYFINRIKPDYEAHKYDKEYLKKEVLRVLKRVDCPDDNELVLEVKEQIKFLELGCNGKLSEEQLIK